MMFSGNLALEFGCTFGYIGHMSGVSFKICLHFVSKQIKSERPHGARELTGVF